MLRSFHAVAIGRFRRVLARLPRMKSLVAIAMFGLAMTPCIWDSDTLDTELRGLPDAFDLIVGRWHRHSDAYYEQRITKIGGKESLSLDEFDDLAVAYERLQQRDKAIEVMARKAGALAKTPDKEHQYRYHANLGTFYAHSGKFDEALIELRTAIKINPAAHFGREVYQIELIEYVAAAKKDPAIWKRRSFLRHAGYGLSLYIGAEGLQAADLGPEDRNEDWGGKRKVDWDAATKAVGGMLRFGGLEGAELYRSLGELYLAKQHLNLAWWAFGHAAERGHPATETMRAVQRSIEKHWDEARSHKNTGHVNPTQADYTKKRAEADAWLAAFQHAEMAAIERGEDVRSDAVLKALLDYANGVAPVEPPASSEPISWSMVTFFSAIGLFVILLAFRVRMGRN